MHRTTIRLIGAAAVAALGLAAAPQAFAQWAGSNVTGTTGLIAMDKIGDKVRFYDPVTLKELKVIDPPGKSVHEMTIAYDHKTAYAPLYGDGVYGNNPEPNNKIIVVDLPSKAITKVIDLGPNIAPHGMVATHDGKIWVTADLSSKLMLIDPVKGVIEAQYDNPNHGGHFISILPNDSKIYISNKEGPITVFDTKARKFLPSIPVGREGVAKGNGSGSEGITISPDGKRVIVIDNDTSSMRVIDTATDKEIDKVGFVDKALTNPKRSRLMKLMFSPDGKYLVVTDSAGGAAWVIDGNNLRKQVMIPVSKGPQGMAFAPDGKTALVSSHDEGLLTKIDLATGKALGEVDGGTGIEVLAWY